MEQTVPYVDQTQWETPFVDFFIPVNPPVRVSTVSAGRISLLSEKDNQIFLVKLENLAELYGTTMYAVDKITGEMYTVVKDSAKRINLQAYVEEEPTELEGAVGFTPQDASTPKNPEVQGKSKSLNSKPSDLSTIGKQT